ncbi:MAG TPA: cytochrome c [Candidatus Acidoferrales bacterium]|nr:cytochrome c [Candidatus Acidoferrales bacterium]
MKRGAKLALAAAVLTALLAGCAEDSSQKTDAELGLNAQQATGRHLYQQACAPCHDAHSVPGQNGPSLKRLFKKQFLPSGLPVNERFVLQTILNGRGMMPAAGRALSQQQLDDLLAYLRTL